MNSRPDLLGIEGFPQMQDFSVLNWDSPEQTRAVDHPKNRRDGNIPNLFTVWTNSAGYLVKNLLSPRGYILVH